MYRYVSGAYLAIAYLAIAYLAIAYLAIAYLAIACIEIAYLAIALCGKRPSRETFYRPQWEDHKARSSHRNGPLMTSNARQVSISVVLTLTLSLAACSGGGGGGATAPFAPLSDAAGEDVPPASATPPSTGNPVEPTAAPVVPPAIAALEDGGALLSDYPPVRFVDTLANTGVQIGYTAEGQQERTDTDFIEEQWEYMQRCLEETGTPPLIILVEGAVETLTVDDEVLRYIDGSAIASSSVSLSGTVIQLSEDDLYGFYGVPGFNLRQIIGRSLWSDAGLPERDYPTTCARLIEPLMHGMTRLRSKVEP